MLDEPNVFIFSVNLCEKEIRCEEGQYHYLLDADVNVKNVWAKGRRRKACQQANGIIIKSKLNSNPITVHIGRYFS